MLLENEAILDRVVPLSVNQYHTLSELGLVPTKTELIEGFILRKMTKSPLHSYVINILHNIFTSIVPTGLLVRKEDPLTLSSSEPEPDLSIVQGEFRDFKTTHPQHAELVIEVAISSVDLDRAKEAVYAQAGIPAYWIVLPEQQSVEVYLDPGQGSYRTVTLYQQDQSIPTPWGPVELAQVFSA